MKGVKVVARAVIDKSEKGRTTIELNKTLLTKMFIHAKENNESQTEFLTRAIINQMENDGNITIRSEMEEEFNG